MVRKILKLTQTHFPPSNFRMIHKPSEDRMRHLESTTPKRIPTQPALPALDELVSTQRNPFPNPDSQHPLVPLTSWIHLLLTPLASLRSALNSAPCLRHSNYKLQPPESWRLLESHPVLLLNQVPYIPNPAYTYCSHF